MLTSWACTIGIWSVLKHWIWLDKFTSYVVITSYQSYFGFSGQFVFENFSSNCWAMSSVYWPVGDIRSCSWSTWWVFYWKVGSLVAWLLCLEMLCESATENECQPYSAYSYNFWQPKFFKNIELGDLCCVNIWVSFFIAIVFISRVQSIAVDSESFWSDGVVLRCANQPLDSVVPCFLQDFVDQVISGVLI